MIDAIVKKKTHGIKNFCRNVSIRADTTDNTNDRGFAKTKSVAQIENVFLFAISNELHLFHRRDADEI